MNKLVPTTPQTIQLASLRRQTLEQLQRMEETALTAKVGIEQLSEIYSYGEYKTIHALSAADLCRKSYELSGGKLTPSEEAAYTALRQQYLDQMRAISQLAGADVIRAMTHSPQPPPRRLLDLLRG